MSHQAGNLVCGPMNAHCLTDGKPIGHDPQYETVVPLGEDMVVNMYRHITVYCEKVRDDLKRIGAWDRLPFGRISHHRLVVVQIW